MGIGRSLWQAVPVTTPPDGLRLPSPRHRWWAVPLAGLALVAAAAPLVTSFVPTRFFVEKTRCNEYDISVQPPVCVDQVTEPVQYALVPADAEPVAPRLSVNGTEVYDRESSIYFVTIREPGISVLDWFVTRKHEATELMSRVDKFGDQTPQQLIDLGQLQMRTAKDNAVYVALSVAGVDVTLQPGKLIIGSLLCLRANLERTECLEYSPADEVLDPGDVITGVNGTPIATVDDLRPILDDLQPGDVVQVEFERDGETMSGEVETILAPGEDPARTIIGFTPIDTTTILLPDGVEVSLDTDKIGGPSAGLAFTLTLLDRLTEGSLTGGAKVAVTGTISLDGTVGPIGGLAAKAKAVQQTGVKYFLVPAAQGEEQIAYAQSVVGDDVRVVPVADLAEALAFFTDELGGDPILLP